uniref:Uncharacterized protein n=1 Tax=Meloidogyne javanica TaxID=6303 RepID=A0A915LNY5_MELJA
MTQEQAIEEIDLTFFTSQMEADNLISNLTNVIQESHKVNEDVKKEINEQIEKVKTEVKNEVNIKLENLTNGVTKNLGKLTTVNTRLQNALGFATRFLANRHAVGSTSALSIPNDGKKILTQTRSLGSVTTKTFVCPHCGRQETVSNKARHFKSGVCTGAQKRKLEEESDRGDGKKCKTTEEGSDGGQPGPSFT